MSEVSQRGANFFKFFSMFLFLGSLIYMYAYTADRSGIAGLKDGWIYSISREYVFYAGLGTFAIINLAFNYWINAYKKVKGIDERSYLFRSKLQKERLLLWFTYLPAGLNFLLTTIVGYIALININEASTTSGYIYLPVTGLIVLAVIIVGLASAFFKK